jgi:hypothetical protein
MKELVTKNSVYEKLRNEIMKKYENSNKDNLQSNYSLNVNASILSVSSNKSSNRNKSSTPSQSSFTETSTNLKVLHSNLENNYMHLLKSLSKKIMKPKDLLRKADPSSISYKIK